MSADIKSLSTLEPKPVQILDRPSPITSKKLGWWANHEYRRHSVTEIEEFIGWDKLTKICQQGKNPRDQALVATLFETGCRVSECLNLKVGHFDLSDSKWVRCVEVPIVKQKKIRPFRTFSFLKSEPLWPTVEKWISIRSQINPYNKNKPVPSRPLFLIGYSQAQKIVKDMGVRENVEIYPHWFRAQRASQIGVEYRFSEVELMEWFKVIDRKWARRYCKLGDFGLRLRMEEHQPETWRA